MKSTRLFGFSTAGKALLLVPALACSSNNTPTLVDGGNDSAPPMDEGGDAACEGGFAASAAMFMASPACTTCVETKCTKLAEACTCDPACIDIIECQIQCVAEGGVSMAEDCAMSCIANSTNSTANGEAESFDLGCLATGAPCSSLCVVGPKMGDASID
jgi:hypothetical protein